MRFVDSLRWLVQRRRIRTGSTGDDLADVESIRSMLDEAQALVEGRAVDRLCAAGIPVPAWAWLNALAHRPATGIDEVVALAVALEADHPIRSLACAMSQLRNARDEIIEFQRGVLVTAELHALSEGSTTDQVDAALRVVRRHLSTG